MCKGGGGEVEVTQWLWRKSGVVANNEGVEGQGMMLPLFSDSAMLVGAIFLLLLLLSDSQTDGQTLRIASHPHRSIARSPATCELPLPPLFTFVHLRRQWFCFRMFFFGIVFGGF